MSSLSILKAVAIATGAVFALYSFYCYMFPAKKIQSIVPKQILEFKESLENKLNSSSKNVLFKYPRVELIPFNFVQPFIKQRGYIEHFELSMDAARKNIICMFKFGVDMQGYLQHIHNGAVLALLEELKNMLLEHFWGQKGQMRTENSAVSYLRPIKLHKIYFFVGEVVSDEEALPGADTNIKHSTSTYFKVIDEKDNVYFESRCNCVNIIV